MGIVAGFADANLYLNQLPDAYKEPYSTALAAQMKRLGYKSDFGNAGPSSWKKSENLHWPKALMLFMAKGIWPVKAAMSGVAMTEILPGCLGAYPG